MSGPAAILLAWWVVTATGLISADQLPSPRTVFDAGVELTRNGQLPDAIWASFKRVVFGTVIGVTAGAAIAVVAGLTRRGDDFVDPTMQIVKSVPKYALIPLLIIWLGIDEAPKIALIAALKVKVERPEATIMYVRRLNRRGDTRHPPHTLTEAIDQE